MKNVILFKIVEKYYNVSYGLQGVISAAVEEQVSQAVAIDKSNIVRIGGEGVLSKGVQEQLSKLLGK